MILLYLPCSFPYSYGGIRFRPQLVYGHVDEFGSHLLLDSREARIASGIISIYGRPRLEVFIPRFGKVSTFP